jgi:hypothetical protein
MVQEILDAFYTWPLILPQELVYFFRAAALLEGIGFRYDPHFNGMEAIKPVVARMRASCCRPLPQAEGRRARPPRAGGAQLVRALHDLVIRAEREELRLAPTPATSAAGAVRGPPRPAAAARTLRLGDGGRLHAHLRRHPELDRAGGSGTAPRSSSSSSSSSSPSTCWRIPFATRVAWFAYTRPYYLVILIAAFLVAPRLL